MHAFGHYIVGILGKKKDMLKGIDFLRKELDEDLEDNAIVMIDENYEIVWLEDMVTLAENLAKKVPNSQFVFSGFIDCAENCGEVMQFGIIYKNRELAVYNSDWLTLDDNIDEVYSEIESYVPDDEELVEEYFEEIVDDILSGDWDCTDTITI